MSPISELHGRHEIKLVLDPPTFERVALELALHRSGLWRQFPRRRVQSLYFDRAGEPAAEDSRDGLSERGKLRLRWYGDAARGARARLELKERRSDLVFKSAIELPQAIDVEGASCVRLVELVRRLLPPLWRERLGHDEHPTQWIAYERDYFVTASGAVRVTFDCALEAFEQRFDARVSRRARVPLPRVRIVELKAVPEALDEAREICTSLAARPERCSKLLVASQPRALADVFDLG